MRCLFRERLLARGSTASDAIACVHIILAGSLADPRMCGEECRPSVTRIRQLTLFPSATAHVPSADSMAQLPYAFDATPRLLS